MAHCHQAIFQGGFTDFVLIRYNFIWPFLLLDQFQQRGLGQFLSGGLIGFSLLLLQFFKLQIKQLLIAAVPFFFQLSLLLVRRLVNWTEVLPVLAEHFHYFDVDHRRILLLDNFPFFLNKK